MHDYNLQIITSNSSFIIFIDVKIFSDQMKLVEQLQQNLKINVKLVDL